MPPSHVMTLAVGAALRTFDPVSGPQLLEPDPASIKLILLAFIMAILGILVAAALRGHRQERERRAKEARKLDAYLENRGLTIAEREMLSDIVRASGEPATRVAKVVLSFDRGVDQYLLDLPAEPDDDRVLRLRRLKHLRSKLDLDRVAAGVPLLSSREIAVGQEMLFRLSANPRANVYAACLVDWDDAGLVLEVSSAPGSEPAFRDQGQRAIDVYFLRRNDGGYRFHSKVLTEVQPVPGAACDHTFLQVAHPKKLLREQRRHYLRVPLHEEVRFSRPVPRSAADPRGKESFEAPPLDQTGTISDFSGGGFRLCADGIPIRVDDIILVRLTFLDPPYDKETLVARSMKIYSECTEFGFAFEDLPAATAAAIVRFVETTHRRMAVSFARPALTR